MSLTLRFLDWQRYDIQTDSEVMMLQGITGKGTFTATFPIKSASDVRDKRKIFRDYVEHAVSFGIEPHEVDLETALV